VAYVVRSVADVAPTLHFYAVGLSAKAIHPIVMDPTNVQKNPY